jgi:hypothetical protein
VTLRAARRFFASKKQARRLRCWPQTPGICGRRHRAGIPQGYGARWVLRRWKCGADAFPAALYIVLSTRTNILCVLESAHLCRQKAPGAAHFPIKLAQETRGSRVQFLHLPGERQRRSIFACRIRDYRRGNVPDGLGSGGDSLLGPGTRAELPEQPKWAEG